MAAGSGFSTHGMASLYVDRPLRLIDDSTESANYTDDPRSLIKAEEALGSDDKGFPRGS